MRRGHREVVPRVCRHKTYIGSLGELMVTVPMFRVPAASNRGLNFDSMAQIEVVYLVNGQD